MKNRKIILFILTAFMLMLLIACNNETTVNVPEVEEESDNPSKGKDVSLGGKHEKLKEIPDGFRVTTIGAGSPPTGTERSWPSTLVQYKDKYFLVDCGGGCTHGLAKAGINPNQINNILFSHHHADHNSDFLTILIAGWATFNPRTELNIIGTVGTQKMYDFALDFYRKDLEYRINEGYTSSDGIITNVNVKELSGGEEIELDGVTITNTVVPHAIEALAYRFDAEDQSVVVTGDTKFSKDLIELSKDADLMIMDGMLTEVKRDDPLYNAFQGIKPSLLNAHISLEEIGKTAAKANVKTLVLTHLMNGEIDEELTAKIIKDQGYTGEIIIAETSGQYEVE